MQLRLRAFGHGPNCAELLLERTSASDAPPSAAGSFDYSGYCLTSLRMTIEKTAASFTLPLEILHELHQTPHRDS
jgi:hypothetical protein